MSLSFELQQENYNQGVTMKLRITGNVANANAAMCGLHGFALTIAMTLVLPMAAGAANLWISGTTNITEDATYDQLVVNGDLTVAEGITIRATEFYMGWDNGNNRAMLTLQRNASFIIDDFGENDFRCRIGRNSPATITMKENSYFKTTTCVCGGQRDADVINRTVPFVRIILENAVFELTSSFQTRAKSHDGSAEVAVVELRGANAVLNPLSVVAWVGNLGFRFDGGRILFDREYNWGNSALIRNNPWTLDCQQRICFESVDGAPIRIDCKDITITDGRRPQLFDNMVDGSVCEIATSGTGAFQLEGGADYPLFKNTYGSVEFGHTGGFKVLDGAQLTLSAAAEGPLAAQKTSPLWVAPTASLDLYGCNATFSSIEVNGVITNALATPASLRLNRFDGAGITGGRALWYYNGSSYSSFTAPDGTTHTRLADFTSGTSYTFTNLVELCPWAATKSPHELFAYGESDYNRVFVDYDGWIWNRSPTNEMWSFAGAFGTHTYLKFDNQIKYKYTSWQEGKGATFSVAPGPHRFQLRSYGTLSPAGTVSITGSNYTNGWSWTDNGVGAGVRIDRLGRDSRNAADYSIIEDPGDGSLLTLSQDGQYSIFRPEHSIVAMDMAQVSVLDFFGNRVTVDGLVGFGVVTNSNPYFDGTLAVTGTWNVVGSDVASGGVMKVFGGVAWGSDATIAVSDPKALVGDLDYVVLESSVAMTSVPSVIAVGAGSGVELCASLSADGKRLLLRRRKNGIILIYF